MTKKTTDRAKRDGRKPAAAEDGDGKPKAPDHFEIRVAAAPSSGAVLAARLTLLGLSREEVTRAVREMKAKERREAAVRARPDRKQRSE